MSQKLHYYFSQAELTAVNIILPIAMKFISYKLVGQFWTQTSWKA